MLEVILSEHYQIAIPKEIINLLHLKAGQVFAIAIKDNSISLAPTSSIASLRGILKGANVNNIRDRKERI